MPHSHVRFAAREVLERDTQGRAGVVERAESVLAIGVLVRLEHYGRVETEPAGEYRMVGRLDRAAGQRHASRTQGRGRGLPFDDETGRFRRLGGDTEQACDDVGGPGGDDPEHCVGVDQALGHVMDDAVTTHRGDDSRSTVYGLCCFQLCIRGGVGPDRLNLGHASQRRHHRPMCATCELGRRRIGDDHDAVHWGPSLPMYPPAP